MGPDKVSIAKAPGKAILFGEHAINRGQAALATAVGLYATCRVVRAGNGRFRFCGGGQDQSVTRESLITLAQEVEKYRAASNHDAIRALARDDYFSPSKYILASAFGAALPDGLDIAWESEIPASSGFGSGGAAFVALVAALGPFFQDSPTLEQRAGWAHLGDIIAHGGIASALDTQTSLLGGVIRFTGKGLAASVPCAAGLSLVIGDTGVFAPTSEVNTRVRRWLEEQPTGRMAYFSAIGLLSRTALPALASGDWPELGRLINLNQLILAQIGVSCPEITVLVEATLEAGAYGAKISGSGGGGIVIALVSEETKQGVAEAMGKNGATVYTPEVGIQGVRTYEGE